jgi:phytoene synthase
VLAALCGIEREIAASARQGIDHHVAHTRLEWWRAECERTAAGDPAHPLTRELLTHLQDLAPAAQARSALAELSGFVDTATWDLAGATFQRRAELTAYCQRWAAAMMSPLATASAGTKAPSPGLDGVGVCVRRAAPAAGEWGAALREIELLGNLAREARSGLLRVPLDELEQAQISPQSLATPPWPPGLVRILRGRHQALRRQLAAAVANSSPENQQRARGLLVWTALASRASARAEHALPQPPATSIASAAAANWRAWRAARAASAGRLRLRG